MPPVSQAQRAAMHAAAAGKSTLGIPKKVAQEFVAADPGGKLPRSLSPDQAGGRSPRKRGKPTLRIGNKVY
jgi:hypothetical protein